MNMVSWFIYGAEVAGNVKFSLVVITIIIMFFIVMFWVFRGMAAIDVYDNDLPDEYHPEGTSDYRRWMSVKRLTEKKSLYAVVIVAWLIAALIPTQKTMYLIAGSEIAEVVVTSPEAVEMFNDVKAVIQKRLRDELETE